MHPTARAFMLIGPLAAVSGCSLITPKPSPAALCAAPDTAVQLAEIAYGGDPNVKLVLGAAVLDSFDKITKKVSCTADLSLQFSGPLAKVDPAQALGATALGIGGGDPETANLLKSRVSYSAQPSADGKGEVYVLPQLVAGALKAWVTAAKGIAAQSAQAVSGSSDATTAGQGPVTPMTDSADPTTNTTTTTTTTTSPDDDAGASDGSTNTSSTPNP